MKSPIIVINPTASEMFKLKQTLLDDNANIDISTLSNVSSKEELIEAIVSGGTIKLNENITIDNLEIPAGVNVVLDLAGKTLTSSINPATATKDNPIFDIVVNGNLTIKNGDLPINGIDNNGNLTLINTTITKESNYGAAVKNEENATLITDSNTKFVVNAVGSASDSSGAACIRNFGNLVVNGSTFESLSMRTYTIINNGSATINSTTINGTHGGIACDEGTLIIKDGIYKAARYYGAYLSNDDGSNSSIEIYGGTFEGGIISNGNCVLIGSDDKDAVDSYCKIYGGTFEGNVQNQKNVLETYGAIIYGGKFKTKPDDSYIAEGYVCSEEANSDGYYIVTKA